MFFVPSRTIEWIISIKSSAEKAASTAEKCLAAVREELADSKARLAAKDEVIATLRIQQATDRANLDWMKARVNQLEYERAELVNKTAGLNFPVPTLGTRKDFEEPSYGGFEDIGDDLAERLGLGSTSEFQDQGDEAVKNGLAE